MKMDELKNSSIKQSPGDYDDLHAGDTPGPSDDEIEIK